MYLSESFYFRYVNNSAYLILVNMNRDAPRGGAGGAAAPPPDFGRSEGAAGQQRRAALVPAPLDF